MGWQALKRWRIPVAAAMVTCAFSGWVAYRARQPEFSFLAGHEPLGMENGEPVAIGWGPREYQTEYSWHADYSQVVQMADRELIPAGWDRLRLRFPKAVVYEEPQSWGRTVEIDDGPALSVKIHAHNSQPEVEITVTRYGSGDIDWKDQAKHWLAHVFLGRP